MHIKIILVLTKFNLASAYLIPAISLISTFALIPCETPSLKTINTYGSMLLFAALKLLIPSKNRSLI